jgi:DNA-binding MarR family transcriptional regulator
MFKNCLFYATTSLSRRLEAVWSDAYASLELTATQAFVLRVVLSKPNIESGVLIETLYLSKSEIAQTLKDLDDIGMIERVQPEGEGRTEQIKPTQLAFDIEVELLEISKTVIKQLNESIGKELYLDMLSKIYKSKDVLS